MAERRFLERELVQLTLVRFREFIREPEAVFWTFVFPLVLAAGLGLAFRSKPADQVRVGVVGQTEAAGARALAALQGSALLEPRLLTPAGADSALRHGEVALVVGASEAGATYRFDPTRPEGRTARAAADEALQRAAGRVDPVQAADEPVTEKGARYIDFFIPGLLGMNIMGSAIWGLVFGLVELRRRKLLKRLVATPMSRAKFLASFFLARLVFLAVETTVIVGFGALVFGVPIRGSLALVGAAAVCTSLAFSGMGLLISSRAATIEGASGLTNLVMFPGWIFGGVFFSAANFPDVMQPVIRALPLTAAVEALRAIMLRGAGPLEVAPPLAIVAAWGLVSYALAYRFFRWK